MNSHAAQNLYQQVIDSLERPSNLSIPIPKRFFNHDYPVEPKTFGERLRKARIDFGMQIKEVASMLGVTEVAVINRVLRGVKPVRKQIKEKVAQFLMVPYSNMRL